MVNFGLSSLDPKEEIPRDKKRRNDLAILWCSRGRGYIDAALALSKCKTCPPNSEHAVYGTYFLSSIVLNVSIGLELVLQSVTIIGNNEVKKGT